MTRTYEMLLILVAALVTVAIRFAPFEIFGRGQEVPKWIVRLGRLLPPAAMSVLLIYCLRSVELLSGNHGLPEFISVAAVMLLHAWKRNTLLSICAGTLLYMLLIRVM